MRSTNLNQLQKNTTKTPTKTAPVLGAGDNYPQDLAQALLRIIKTVCASAQPIPMVPKAAWACLAKSMEKARERAQPSARLLRVTLQTRPLLTR